MSKKTIWLAFGAVFLISILGWSAVLLPQETTQASEQLSQQTTPRASPQPTQPDRQPTLGQPNDGRDGDGTETDGDGDGTPETWAQEGWRQDPKVTGIGRFAVRVREMVDWTLRMNEFGFEQRPLLPIGKTMSPIAAIWMVSLRFVDILLVIVLIFAGIGLILQTQWFPSLRNYLPLFIILVAAAHFSFLLSSLLIDFGNLLQNSFLAQIDAKDLLTVGFGYDFEGFSRGGEQDEARRVTLGLVNITSWTHIAIITLLLFRLIILWFMVALSPIFTVLWTLPFTRGIARVWGREFFRWLFFSPLLAFFLFAIVGIWKITPQGIPVASEFAGESTFPTSVNILLAPPQYEIEGTKSLPDIDQFMRYFIALLMLWAAIILTFLLLRFLMNALGYLGGRVLDWARQRPRLEQAKERFLPSEQPPLPRPTPSKTGVFFQQTPATIQQVVQTPQITASRIQNVKTDYLLSFYGLPPSVSLAKREKPVSELAKTTLEGTLANTAAKIAEYFTQGVEKLPEKDREATELLRGESLKRATRGDEQARKLLAMIEQDYSKLFVRSPQEELGGEAARKLRANVSGLVDPRDIEDPQEKAKLEELHNILFREERWANARKGLDDFISRAKASSAHLALLAQPELAPTPTDRAHLQALREFLTTQATTSPKAKEILDLAQKVATTMTMTPDKLLRAQAEEADRVVKQLFSEVVSFEDYEEAKRIFAHHYQSAQPPDPSMSKFAWINHEIEVGEQTLQALLSSDPAQRAKGVQAIQKILPFIVIGNYGLLEVVSFLKARIEAARVVKATIPAPREKVPVPVKRAAKEEVKRPPAAV